MINIGEHFLGAAARNLLVQNEKGIMLTINNNWTPGICGSIFRTWLPPFQVDWFAMDLLHQHCKFLGQGETTSFLSAKHGFSFVAVSMSFPRLRSNRFKSNGNFMVFLLFILRKRSHLFNAAGRDACIGESGLNSYSPVGWRGPHTPSPTAGGVWLSETPLMGELLECWTSPAECWC